MLDPKRIRAEIDRVREAIAFKKITIDLERYLERDERRRELIGKAESLKHRKNQASEEIGRKKKAGQDGSFVIADVPAGKYTLKAWNERTDEPAREITIPAQGDVEAALTLDASAFKRVSHKNKFGKDYSGDEKY